MMSEKEKLFFKSSWVYFAIALIIGLGGAFAVSILYPATPIKYSWEGILMFLTLCAGVGWVIHGTGFLIVKVN